MALAISPAQVSPILTVAMPAISSLARAAAVPMVLGPNRQSVIANLDNLPPNLSLNTLGSIYVDNTANTFAAAVSFADTGAVFTVPGGAALYVLAVTGGKRFTISSPVAVPTAINCQVFNVEVTPTGTQPVIGSVVVTAGAVTVANPGPISVVPASRSADIGAGASTPLVALNLARQFLLFQMPQGSDGWVNFDNGAAVPNGGDSFYMQAGEKFLSTGAVPTGAISVWLTNAGHVPCLEL